MESTIFTPWSKKVIPFPSLRHKIQAYQDDKRSERVLLWNNGSTFQFFAPPMMQNNPRKRAPGKIRARWPIKSRYNPMKGKRPSTPEMTMTKLDNIDTDKKAPLSVRICNRFGPSWSFCKQNISHPSPQESDWSDRDWTGAHKTTQKETRETNLLSDWYLYKPQSEPNSKLEVDIDKLNLEQDSPKEEWIKVTDSLILPPTMIEEEEKATTEELMEVDIRYQQEEEKYMLWQKVYIGQLREEEESDTSSDYSGYSYFG